MRIALAIICIISQLSVFAQADEVSAKPEKIAENVLNFAKVETVPVAKGCKDGSNEELKLCFQTHVLNHIAKKFKYPKSARRLGIHCRIFVNFIIEKDGSISSVEAVRSAESQYTDKPADELSAARELDEEAIRVIKKLKIKKPAYQRGKPVRMSFTIPINLKLS